MSVAEPEAFCVFGLVVLGRLRCQDLQRCLGSFPLWRISRSRLLVEFRLSRWFLSATEGASKGKLAHVETCLGL